MTRDLYERGERLWMPVVAPIIWSAHFTVCYIAVALWCGRFAGAALPAGREAAIGIATAVALTAIAGLFLHGLHRRGYQLPDRPQDADTPEDRRQFLAFMTMLLAGLSFVATAYAALAMWVVEGCG